jgi:hypothetical protein
MAAEVGEGGFVLRRLAATEDYDTANVVVGMLEDAGHEVSFVERTSGGDVRRARAPRKSRSGSGRRNPQTMSKEQAHD